MKKKRSSPHIIGLAYLYEDVYVFPKRVLTCHLIVPRDWSFFYHNLNGPESGHHALMTLCQAARWDSNKNLRLLGPSFVRVAVVFHKMGTNLIGLEYAILSLRMIGSN